MSYEIIFNRLSVKSTNGKIIPLVLAGNSSLTEETKKGRTRVVREWRPAIDVVTSHQEIFFEANEYFDEASNKIAEEMKSINSDWTSKHYYGLRIEGKHASYKMMRGYFNNNLKHAIPIELYLKTYGPFVIQSYITSPDTFQRIDLISTTIDTPNALLIAEQAHNDLLQKTIENQYVLVDFHWIEENPFMKYYNCAERNQ